MKAFSFFLILFLQATTQRAESRVEYCQSKADDALHRVTLSFQRSEVYLNQTSYFPLKESVRVQPSPQNDSYQFLGGLDRFSFTVTFTNRDRESISIECFEAYHVRDCSPAPLASSCARKN